MISQQTADQLTGAGLALPVAASTLLAGADPTGLVMGLIGAVVMTFFLGSIDSRWKAGAGILFASLLAGYAGPVVAVAILHQWPDWRPVMDAAHPLVSLLIGASAPTIIPALLRGLARRAERFGGGE